NRDGVVGAVGRTGDDAHLYEFGRDDGKARTRGKPKTGELQDEHEHVGGNDANRHPLVAEKLERVVIREGNEEQALLLPRLRLQWMLENRPSASCRNSDREARFAGGPCPEMGAQARPGGRKRAQGTGQQAPVPPANSFVMRAETFMGFAPYLSEEARKFPRT